MEVEKCFMCEKEALHECVKCGRWVCEMDSYCTEEGRICPICRTSPSQIGTVLEIIR